MVVKCFALGGNGAFAGSSSRPFGATFTGGLDKRYFLPSRPLPLPFLCAAAQSDPREAIRPSGLGPLFFGGTSSDRRLSSLSGPNANRFLNRHNKNPAVIQSSCSGLTYNGLNRAPNAIIRDDDFKF